MNMDFAVGIDLGTTNSVVAVYRNEKVEVLLDDKGYNMTPSVVAYTATEILVGYKAIKQYADNPANTITEVKRLMGRKFDEKQVQEDKQNWPFRIVDKQGEPRIEVDYRAETRQFRPEQVSSHVLLNLRLLVCKRLDIPKQQLSAVVTVPVYFGDSERNATKEACEIAGFTVLRIITEPAAAALAYTLQTAQESPCRVLVFDMGGGTTDVSLLRVSPGQKLEVLFCCGDNHLGGEDLDTLLVEQCMERIYEDHKLRLHADFSRRTRLRIKCEKAKRKLTHETKATIKLQQILTNADFEYSVTRDTFEALATPLLQKSLRLIEKCLAEAKLAACDVSKLILAGGSTHIPLLQALLSNLLPGVPVHTTVNQEEAVACGAALQAAKDLGIYKDSFTLSEILPWSLSTDVEDGKSCIILAKNTPIPARAIKTFSTTVDNQKTIPVEIYEGEEKFCKDNKFLGSMTLTDITLAPRGTVKVRVGFCLDENGILHAVAREKDSDNKVSVKIDRYKKQLTVTQVESLKFTVEEDCNQGLVAKLAGAMELLKMMTKQDTSMPVVQRKCVKAQCEFVKNWEKSHPNPTDENLEELVVELRKKFETLGLDVTFANDGVITYNGEVL